MLRGALATPARSDDAAGTLVIGTVLTLLAWVVTPAWVATVLVAPVVVVAAPLALAPAFVAPGYFVRVVAGGVATENADGAPRFVGWGRLYRDGLKSAALSAAYLLPLLVALVGVGLAGVFVELGRVDVTPFTDPIVTGLDGDVEGTNAVLGVVGGFVGVLSLAYLALFAYVRPAALAAFAATGRLRDGFRPLRVGRVALDGDYAVAWSLAAVTLITGYTLAAPFVPLLVGVTVVFAVRIVVHALYGRGAAATPSETRSSTPDLGVDRTGDGTGRTGRASDPESPPDPGIGRPEPPPAVQAGRPVPMEGSDAGSNDGATRNDSSEENGETVGIGDGDFDWGPSDDGASSDRADSPVNGDDDGKG